MNAKTEKSGKITDVEFLARLCIAWPERLIVIYVSSSNTILLHQYASMLSSGTYRLTSKARNSLNTENIPNEQYAVTQASYIINQNMPHAGKGPNC